MITYYSTTTLRRIESTADTVGRVLNLKDKKNLLIKQERYLTNITNWLNQCGIDKLGAEITGCKFEEIVSSLEVLTDKLEMLNTDLHC